VAKKFKMRIAENIASLLHFTGNSFKLIENEQEKILSHLRRPVERKTHRRQEPALLPRLQSPYIREPGAFDRGSGVQ
jgi:hypothetical protein